MQFNQSYNQGYHSVTVSNRVDLLDFLATGNFLGLGVNSKRKDVQSVLGTPDDTGLVSRKHSLPRIWIYGGIELTFGLTDDSTLELIHFDEPNLPPSGSASLCVDPWVLKETAMFDDIINACREVGIKLTHNRTTGTNRWITGGNVHLTFSDDCQNPRLVAVSSVLAPPTLG